MQMQGLRSTRLTNSRQRPGSYTRGGAAPCTHTHTRTGKFTHARTGVEAAPRSRALARERRVPLRIMCHLRYVNLGVGPFFTRMQACLLLHLCFGFNKGAGAPCLRARVLGSLAVYVVEGHSQGGLSWEAGP